MTIKDISLGVLSNPKVGVITSASLVTTGVFDWIPPDISRFASAFGIAVGASVILANLFTQWRSYEAAKRESALHQKSMIKLDLEIDALKKGRRAMDKPLIEKRD